MSNLYAEYSTEGGCAEYVMSLFPKDFIGICVEVGAYAPFWLSDSWIFQQKNWDTYCIEPNPKCIPALRNSRTNVYEYARSEKNEDDVNFYVYSYTGESEASWTGLIKHHEAQDILVNTLKVKVRTLDWLMENELKIDNMDYLSIDVERDEMRVLRGTNISKYNPKVVTLESFDELPSQKEQRDWMKDLGYTRIHRIMFNDIYVLSGDKNDSI